MRANTVVTGACALALAGVLAMWMATPAAPTRAKAVPTLPSTDFAIRGARVFDGEKVFDRVNVIVRAGLVTAVVADAPIDASLQVVDGAGMTLLPGLIDAHVHAFGDARRDALRAGVTTVIDQFGDWQLLAEARKGRESMARTDQADLWGAGTLATAEGGHGTQFGMLVPTLSTPAESPTWVADRIGEGSDFIKIVREDAKLYRRLQPLPTLDRATAAAVISEAHAQSRKAVMHVSTREHAHQAFADGVDGIVHMFQDAPADPALVELVRRRGGFVVATLAVIDGIEGLARTRASEAGASAPSSALLGNARNSVRAFQSAGVPILAGSDAPNFGLAHGPALHAELDQLAAAGLTPVQALVAATSAPATAFGIDGRGRIRRGARADLLLVRGDATRDLAAVHDIVGVWKNGYAVSRERVGGETVPNLAGAPLSDFERDTSSRYGLGWDVSTDRVMGGKSNATVARRSGGAGGSAGSLRVEGTVAAGFAYPWAGALFSPGKAAMQAVDYSSRRELRFRVRGDGRRYAAMLLSGGPTGGAPPMHAFETGAEWREVRVPLAAFAGADTARVWGIGFNAGPPTGDFWFELDDVVVE